MKRWTITKECAKLITTPFNHNNVAGYLVIEYSPPISMNGVIKNNSKISVNSMDELKRALSYYINQAERENIFRVTFCSTKCSVSLTEHLVSYRK